MTQEITADPALGRLAEAILIPPFPGGQEPEWVRAALGAGLGGVTLFGPNVQDRQQLARLTASLRERGGRADHRHRRGRRRRHPHLASDRQ